MGNEVKCVASLWSGEELKEMGMSGEWSVLTDCCEEALFSEIGLTGCELDR